MGILLNQGFSSQCCLQNVQSAASDIFKTILVEGTRDLVNY